MRELLQSTTAYRVLREDARRGEVSHAVLVLFPDEKYLRQLLRECARAMLGEEEGRVSELILHESFSDCLFFPAEAGGKLTVDDGTKIVDESLIRPIEGDKKLFVLDGFHNASPLLQNKLLKTLEEPPQGVYFLLGATSDFSLLPTVLSRVKRLEVAPFSEDEIFKALERNYPDKDGLKRCAAASGGVYATAEELLLGGGESFRLAESLLSGKDTEAFCRSLGDSDVDKRAFLTAVRLCLRDALLWRTGQDRYASAPEVKGLKDYSVGALIASLAWVTEAEKQIKFNANLSQCAETLAIRLKEEKEKWQKLSL
jgi:hypothetical protein